MSFTGDKLYGRQGGRVVPVSDRTDRAYAEWKAEQAAEQAAETERRRAEDVQLGLFEDEPA